MKMLVNNFHPNEIDKNHVSQSALIMVGKNLKIKYVNSLFEKIAGIKIGDINSLNYVNAYINAQYSYGDLCADHRCEDVFIKFLYSLTGYYVCDGAINWVCETVEDDKGKMAGKLYIGNIYKYKNNNADDYTSIQSSMSDCIKYIPGFIGVFSEHGILKDINDYPLREGGVTREDCVGRHISTLFWWRNSPKIANEIVGAINNAIASAEPSQFESSFSLNNKNIQNYVFSVRPFPDYTEHFNHVVVIGLEKIRSVDDRDDSSDTSRILDKIIENLPNMIFLKRADDLRFEYFNRAGEKLLGVEREKLLGRCDYDLFPKEQADFFTAQDKLVLQKNEVVDIPEEPIMTPDGVRILHTKKVALRDHLGRAQYLMGVSEDITERKRTEEKLVHQAKIIDQIHDSVVSTDMGGNIINWNKGAERLHGFTKEEMIGTHISSLICSEDRKDLYSNVIKPLHENGELEVELNLLKKDEGKFIGHLSLSILYDSFNHPIGMIGYCLDITERKLLESELESYRDILEYQVEERTAALASARDEAERANKAKSQFLSKMSHELRTPLNAILGFAQILELEESNFNENQKNSVKEILDAGRHLLSLINEVLDLSKIESGKFELTREVVSISELMQQCMPLVKRDATKNSISITSEVCDTDYLVWGDSIRLKQVLLNLLSNAIKYNRKGGEVYIEARPSETNRLVIFITDTGVGLTENEIQALFTPFHRLGNSAEIEGTGIGLVIVKEIVEAMGGVLGVESAVGKGSSFWIELEMVDSSILLESEKELYIENNSGISSQKLSG